MNKDLTGQKFNMLLVISLNSRNKWSQQLWDCLCDCGKKVIVLTRDLKIGHTKSCGCLQVKHCREQAIRNKTHGMYGTHFYKKFDSILQRCTNPNFTNFIYWGGRGIKCEWTSFEDFKKDMYESYRDHVKKFGEKQTTIDRINNNGNYCKENCKWATYKEQNRNSRNVRLLEYEGEKKSISEWAELYGLTYNILKLRLSRQKWSIEKALNTPVKITKSK